MNLENLDWYIIFGYLVCLILLSVYLSKDQKNLKDYLNLKILHFFTNLINYGKEMFEFIKEELLNKINNFHNDFI